MDGVHLFKVHLHTAIYFHSSSLRASFCVLSLQAPISVLLQAIRHCPSRLTLGTTGEVHHQKCLK